jgi:hypothetical protein
LLHVDPALIDRRTTPLLGIDESTLRERTMVIPGIEGGLDAKILSTDLRGSTTRLVRLRSGWGARIAGAFSGHFELFVIRGAVEIGSETLGTHDYVAVPELRVISGIRATADGLALLMTSAPVRYDTSTGGAPARLHIGRAAAATWEAVSHQPGRYVRTLGTGPTGDVWIGGATHWSQEGGPWHRHLHDEECLVIDGSFRFTNLVEGAVVTDEGTPGTYSYRPAGTLHDGPGSGCDEPSLTFHRAFGSLGTEWVDAEEAIPAT